MSNIELKNICVSFGEKQVLQDFSHTFASGSVTCVMGPSGCGKTTLLNVLIGTVAHQSGSVTGMPKKVACVFQEDRLCEDFSALSNAKIASSFSKEEVVHCLERLGITEIDTKVSQFSGGMKRRVAIARAICADCDVILLDEAFKGLDVASKENAIGVLLEYSKNKTVIAVTHDTEEAHLLSAEILDLS